MKVEFTKDVLKQALNTIERFASICKDKKEDGYLKIEACNKTISLEIGSNYGFIHLGVEGTIHEDGIACINAFDLISIVAKLTDNPICIDVSDTSIIVSDSISKIKLGLINADLFTARMGLAQSSCGCIAIGSKDLKEAARICLPFEDEPQFIPGINLKLHDNQQLRFCCCSNAAMGIYNCLPASITQVDDLDITLPTIGFRCLCNVVQDKEVSIEFFGTIVRIALSDGFITLKTLNKKYPKIDSLISATHSDVLPLKTCELNNALDLIDVIAYDGNVFLEYSNNKCFVSNKAGFHSVMGDIKVKTDTIVKMERRLLRRALKLFPLKQEINLLFAAYKKPVVIKEGNILIMLSVLEQK